jgi:hypothetical protein
MEPNPEEKEAVVERQEIPNEEVAIHSLRACRNERTAIQEATKVNTAKMEPTEHATAILEQIIERLLAGKEEMKAKQMQTEKKCWSE